MTLEELKAIVDGVAKPFREQLHAANQRISDLEARIAAIPAGPQGERGEKGEKGERGNPGERGERGLNGEAGPTGSPGPQGEMGQRGADGPAGPAGKDGRDGVDGKDGQPGRDGVDGKDGERGERGERGLQGEKGDTGLRGEIGPVGPKGDSGERGERGEQGPPGKDVDMEALHLRIESALGKNLLDYERRFFEFCQRAIDSMPKPKDGRDGFGLEDFSLEQDDADVTLKFKSGDLEKVHTLRFAYPKYQGVWKEGDKYREGHSVTFGGSQFISLVDNPTEKPGTGSQWQLAVKRGRDGRDGVMKPPKDDGPVKL